MNAEKSEALDKFNRIFYAAAGYILAFILLVFGLFGVFKVEIFMLGKSHPAVLLQGAPAVIYSTGLLAGAFAVMPVKKPKWLTWVLFLALLALTILGAFWGRL